MLPCKKENDIFIQNKKNIVISLCNILKKKSRKFDSFKTSLVYSVVDKWNWTGHLQVHYRFIVTDFDLRFGSILFGNKRYAGFVEILNTTFFVRKKLFNYRKLKAKSKDPTTQEKGLKLWIALGTYALLKPF